VQKLIISILIGFGLLFIYGVILPNVLPFRAKAYLYSFGETRAHELRMADAFDAADDKCDRPRQTGTWEQCWDAEYRAEMARNPNK